MTCIKVKMNMKDNIENCNQIYERISMGESILYIELIQHVHVDHPKCPIDQPRNSNLIGHIDQTSHSIQHTQDVKNQWIRSFSQINQEWVVRLVKDPFYQKSQK